MYNLDINIAHEILNWLIGLVGHIPLPLAGVGGGIEAKESVDIAATIKFTLVFIAGVGAIFGFGLAFAAKKFSVQMDPRIEQVRDVLAGAQCGACGFAGCQQYAEAVVANAEVKPSLCTPAGKHAAEIISALTGKKAVAMEPVYSRIMCQGDCKKSIKKFKYEGVRDCRAAVLAGGGDKSCAYGCLGYGTCASVCPFDAIHMNEFDLPVVDIKKCTGCRKCAEACPKKVIEILPGSKGVLVACHSKDKGAATRKNCQVGCIACGMCVKVCPFEAPSITDNVSKINLDKCRMCGLCATKCPTHAIVDMLLPRGKAVITESKCIGCNMCMKVCPVNAASGELKKPHTIDAARCIGCGICVAKCPKQAIDGTFNAQEVFEKAAQKKQSA
ncbi:4Fe-4S binding protein [Candidatus Magnetominusculus xianensis]|uniref:Ion-translocating oxidoreductase complex subunit B n=1 Tax=Candidatus Magnetominusculus xianensis TaxID=1748249 RepID=A0ABR5SNA2_9BACT|nr:RnfABCDGE type electron transport complex subunit B [Candidatus Magnetominusculus xianensis]KWT94610.1 electron transporter RnfB [Candidatus Magnetominusculus xianensis]MBF0403322.1 4Fe-4S binding protein [Nitrospirota bacterium]